MVSTYLITIFLGRNALNIGTTRDKIYTIRTPMINVTATTMFCFTFYYLLYRKQAGAIKIAQLINNNKTSIWNSSYENKYTWRSVSLDIEANENFSVSLKNILRFIDTDICFIMPNGVWQTYHVPSLLSRLCRI